MIISSGDPLYVSSKDVAVAMSLGARFVEGDSRLRIPSPMPDGVSLSSFAQWATPEARVIWISEFLEMIVGKQVGLTDVAGIVSHIMPENLEERDLVSLYVPRSDMDRVRLIPGVRWSRNLGMYVADSSTDFGLVHLYLTPRMKAVWTTDQNLDSEIGSLVKARALVAEREDCGPNDIPQLEIEPGEMKKWSED
jgi:hypothetical protein